MSAVHRPPNEPIMNWKMPRATNPMPTNRPAFDAVWVARWRFPCRFQRMACSMRPPSSGVPGIRLKTPSSRLMPANQATSAPGSPSRNRLGTAATAPMMRLMAGPIPAILSSTSGDSVSPSSCARPPSAQRVILSTRTPWRWATTACPSSWAVMAASREMAPTTPPVQ